MKKIIYFLLLISGLLFITAGFGFLIVAWICLDKYGYSTKEMGRDAFGFFSGFIIIGIPLIGMGIILFISLTKVLKAKHRLKKNE